jgi:TRIAD3 protein (E3 ubiquitin-protein ligase RNF216)
LCIRFPLTELPFQIAIGEGKIGLTCLGQCDDIFDLSTLQRALNADVFSKWIKKIQLAEVEKADIEGLERCPFCEFATIMDTSPEENKVFHCQDPDCGRESCRLCHELSHIPLRCEEVEKDAEVRKRTYIENKMTEVRNIRARTMCKSI